MNFHNKIETFAKNKKITSAIIDLKYSDKEKQVLHNFDVDQTVSFNYYGVLNPETIHIPKLNSFIDILGKNDIVNCDTLRDIIYNLISEILIASSKESVKIDGMNKKIATWVHINVIEPNVKYNGPKFFNESRLYWANNIIDHHKLLSDNSHKTDNLKLYKFVTTLVGSSTFSRKKINIKPTNNEGLLLELNNYLYNPDISKPHILLSVYPDTTNHIESLYENNQHVTIVGIAGLIYPHNFENYINPLYYDPRDDEEKIFNPDDGQVNDNDNDNSDIEQIYVYPSTEWTDYRDNDNLLTCTRNGDFKIIYNKKYLKYKQKYIDLKKRMVNIKTND
jgi:hypothetical protein